MSMLQFDENAARQLQRMYSTPDVVAAARRGPRPPRRQPGERVLDVGSGPGFLVASLADAVGPERRGPRTRPERVDERRGPRPARGPALGRIDDGDALALPYPDGAFDAAVSTQVYEYVADVPRALPELRRVLRPGGRALVLDTDWDSVVWHAADRERHRRIMAAWEEHLVHPHLPGILPGRSGAPGSGSPAGT